MRILVVGGGGREHALAWRLQSSTNVSFLCAAPGNPGIKSFAECFDVGIEEVDAMVALAQSQNIDLVVIGPEGALALGLADKLRAKNIATFGPSQKAAQLESSKAFSKDFMARHNIATARYGVFTAAHDAINFLETLCAPYVLKASGLAAGKGVVIAENLEQAKQEVHEMLGGKFGDASSELVIEEFMKGEEASFFVLCNENSAICLPICQDHKRAFDNDLGPNTGGMGAYAPTSLVDEALHKKIVNTIISPTLAGMKSEGNPFNGVLFVGLMIDDANVKVVEYNCRFGDPECQVLMQFMGNDFATCLMQIAKNEAASLQAWPKGKCAINVVLAANGYPNEYEKNGEISGLELAEEIPNVKIFHAGTKIDENGILRANGGRVLGVSAAGANIAEAIETAYSAINKINAPSLFYRKDIGACELGRN